MSQLPQGIIIRLDPASRYLSDDEQFHGGLPPKCLFDKGKTGCGGTTMALNSSHNYVVAVPFISLIKNKLPKHEDVFGVFGDVMDHEIIQYCNTHEVKKFLVTYDSLERLISLIEPASNEPLIDPSKFKLLVDEYHILFTHYGTVERPFRKEAVLKILKNYHRFSDYCFMSATPLEEEFVLEELKDLDLVSALWPKVDPVEVLSVRCQNVLGSVSGIIQKYLNGTESGHAYFFINSLTAIQKLINTNGLTNENTRLIYSESNDKELSISRGDLNGTPKLINFLTSAAFEGSDIEDEDGRTYIVSDHRHPNSLLDISTSFMQISGRIRNTKFSNRIEHLYSRTRHSSLTSYEAYKVACEKDVMEAQQDVGLLNQVSEATRNTLLLKKNSGYLSLTSEGFFVYDANLVKIDLYHFKLTRILYDSIYRLNEAYTQHGFVVNHVESDDQYTTPEAVSKKRISLKEKIHFIKDTGIYGSTGFATGYHYVTDDYHKLQTVRSWMAENPELKEAIQCPAIGFAGFEKLLYNWQLVKRVSILGKLYHPICSKVYH
jgi:hypothetical protein